MIFGTTPLLAGASQERSRWRCWFGPEVRGDYIKTQKSPRLKKHFFDYDALTKSLDQTRYSDHWLKMVLVISRGSGFGCRLSVFGSRRSFSVVSVFARTACTAFALQRFAAGRSNLKA